MKLRNPLAPWRVISRNALSCQAKATTQSLRYRNRIHCCTSFIRSFVLKYRSSLWTTLRTSSLLLECLSLTIPFPKSALGLHICGVCLKQWLVINKADIRKGIHLTSHAKNEYSWLNSMLVYWHMHLWVIFLNKHLLFFFFNCEAYGVTGTARV
jgi:hypothetical protein